MLNELRRALPEGCISDLAFDEWRAGELDSETVESYEEHLEHCEHCQQRHDVIEAQAEAFLEKFPSLDKTRTDVSREVVTLRRRRSRWLGYASGVLTLAAVAVAFLLVLRPPSGGGEAKNSAFRVRSKGGSHIGFFVKHGTEVRRGSDGQVVHPGDQLRFTVTSRALRHVAILSLDGAGVATVYYPRGSSSEALAKLRDQALDSSVKLDDTLGQETIWGIFCDAAFELEPLRQELEQRGRLPPLPECTIDELSIVKEAMP